MKVFKVNFVRAGKERQIYGSHLKGFQKKGRLTEVRPLRKKRNNLNLKMVDMTVTLGIAIVMSK